MKRIFVFWGIVVIWACGAAFAKNQNFYEPAELFPPNDGTIYSFYEKFKWPMFQDDRGNIGKYMVQITLDPKFKSNIGMCMIEVTGTELIPGEHDKCNLKYGKTYYWRISLSENRYWKYSPIASFRLMYEQPYTIDPPKGKEVNSQQPVFKFSIVSATPVYELQIAKDSGFNQIVETVKETVPSVFHGTNRKFRKVERPGEDNVMDTKDDIKYIELKEIESVLQTNTVYYWRARAIYVNMREFRSFKYIPIGESPWSETSSFTVPTQPSNENLESMVLLANTNDFNENNPSVSPDGKSIIYEKHPRSGTSSWAEKREVWMRKVFLDGNVPSASEGETPVEQSLAGSGAASPKWLPDSQRIAFTTNSMKKDEWDVVVKLLNSESKKLVTDNMEFNQNIAVSPDGEFIVYDEFNKEGQWYVWTVQKGGSARTQLTVGRQPSLSPDGKRIVYVRDGNLGNSELWIINSDGSGNTKITSTSRFQEHTGPAWSPAGGVIAYISSESGNYDIWIVNEDGSKKQQLTSYLGSDIGPSWSPDGRYVFFASTRNGEQYDLWIGKVPPDILESTKKSTTSEDGKEKVKDIW